MKNIVLALGVLAGLDSASLPAIAGALHPLQADRSVTDTVYFETRGGGDRLAAALTNEPDGTPVRMIAALAAGQSATMSAPRGVGEPALVVTPSRRPGLHG